MVASLIEFYKKPLARVYASLLLIVCMVQFLDARSLLDSIEYAHSIKYWFQLDTLKLDPHLGRWMYVTRRTPAYPFLLFILGDNGVLIIQFLAGLFSPFFIFKSIQKLQIKINFWWFWSVWLLWPLQFFYTALPMPEILAQCLLSIWLYNIVTQRGVFAGLVLLVMILLKPVFVVFLAPIGLGLLIKGCMILIPFESSKRLMGRFGKLFSIYMLIFPLLGILALLKLNQSRWGIQHISSVSTTNFYEYNRYQILTHVYGQQFTDSVYFVESETINQLSDFSIEKGQILQNLNSQTVKTHFSVFVLLHLKGIAQMFLDPGRYDAMVFFKWQPTSGFLGVKSGHQTITTRPLKEWLFIVVFFIVNVVRVLLLAYALWYVFVKLKKQRIISLFVALNILVYISAIGSVGTARYLLPLYPLIVFIITFSMSLKSQNESITTER